MIVNTNLLSTHHTRTGSVLRHLLVVAQEALPAQLLPPLDHVRALLLQLLDSVKTAALRVALNQFTSAVVSQAPLPLELHLPAAAVPETDRRAFAGSPYSHSADSCGTNDAG